jgi:bifunctional non-homologous end joining protein LigD
MEEKINLYYKEGSSDKVYNLELVKAGSTWEVNFQYGRRGSSLNTGQKISTTIYNRAKTVYDKLVSEKTAKGYLVANPTGSSMGGPIGGSISSAEDTGIRPQLLNEIEEEDLEKYITDDNWCAQEKFDGRRRLLIKQGAKAKGTNRKGLVVGITSEIENDLLKLNTSSVILDGEAFEDHVMVFDSLGENLPYKERYQKMKNLLNQSEETGIIPVSTAWTTEDKRDLLECLRKGNREGIVFKNVNSMYKPGRPNSGGDQLKFKFVTTASCIVGRINAGKRSVSLLVNNDEGKLVEVGNVTVYPNQDIPKLGEIVEVRYLYYFDKGSLFQPVLLGTGDCSRDDIDLKDCQLSKLKLKRQEVLSE